MKKRVNLLILALAISACATSRPSSFEQTHMLHLKCASQGDSEYHSRLAVLDVSSNVEPEFDYGLTTGHGVPPGRPCHVFDFDGRSAPVTDIQFAPNYTEGEQTDWAVLKFDRIGTTGLERYALKPIAAIDSLENLEVTFARARGLPDNKQICRLKILDFSQGDRKVSHNCRNVPGQSGTPITVQVNGKDHLVGLHLGQLWMLQSPVTGRPDRKGYINLFNAKTVAQISDIIDEME